MLTKFSKLLSVILTGSLCLFSVPAYANELSFEPSSASASGKGLGAVVSLDVVDNPCDSSNGASSDDVSDDDPSPSLGGSGGGGNLAEGEQPPSDGVGDADVSGEKDGDRAEGFDGSDTSQVEGSDSNSNSNEFPSDDVGSVGENWAISSGTYLIQPAMSSSRVLDISGGSKSDGGNVQLWSCNQTPAQFFSISADDEGWCVIKNVGSGKVLDVAWGQAQSGANVQQYAANGTLAQKWAAVKNDDGTISFRSALSEKLFLDISSASNADGANVQVWSANGSSAQKFKLISSSPKVEAGSEIEAGVYRLRSALSGGRYLDISAASLENGCASQLWGGNGTQAQMFQITSAGEGFYSVRAVHSGKALDSAGAMLLPGSKVQQWAPCGNFSQKWSFQLNEDGTYTIVCAANNLAIDVSGAHDADGAAVVTYTQNGTAAQKWMLEKVDFLLDSGIYDIRSNIGARRVVDVSSGSASAGANVQTWSYNGTPAQRLRLARVKDVEFEAYTIEPLCSGLLLTQDGDNVVQSKAASGSAAAFQQWRVTTGVAGGLSFVNVASGKALDVSGAGNWDGCNIGVWDLNGTQAQSFVVEETEALGEGTYVIRDLADGRVLDVSSGSRANGANVQVWTSNDTGAQKWIIRCVGGGWYVIENARSKKALDVLNYGAVPGTNVQQWESSNGNSAQKWKIEYAGGGSYIFTSACGGLVLDVSGAGGYDGANVQTYTSNDTVAQRFRLEPTTYSASAEAENMMSDRAQQYYSSTNWLILVDTTQNRVGVFYGSRGGWDLRNFWVCSSGAPSTPTVRGEFTVQAKGYSFGSGYTCYYYTQFYGNYLFHSVLYRQNSFTISDGRLGSNLSHGCVRLSIENAKWIYDNIPRGTKVVVYR